MKIFSLTAVAVIASVSLLSCKKDSSGTPTSSQWTIKGSTYKGTVTTFESSSLLSIDNSLDACEVDFLNTPTSGTYTIADGFPGDDTQCALSVNTGGISNPVEFESTGKTGDKVTVTVSGGKVTATFSNVTVSSDAGTTSTTVSGTLVQTQ